MVFMATILLQKKRFTQAQSIAEEALNIFIKTNDAERQIRCYVTLAELAVHHKDYQQAQKQLDLAATRMKTVDNPSLEIEIDQHRASLFVAKGAWQDAIKRLKRAEKLASQHFIYGLEAELEKRIAELYEHHGAHKEALVHERNASLAQLAADAELRAQHSQGLQLRLEMEREARERERVQATNERLTLQLDTKERELNTNVLAIAQKNELLSELAADVQAALRGNEAERIQHLRDVLRKIDIHRRTGEDWKNFQEQLADVHDTFIRTLTTKHPELTAKEVQLASFLKLNLSSKEISQVLSVGVASIEVYRSNLRKKLGLASGMGLTTYIQSL
jgi:DNA-binding CsgD family transcriptional regulator